MKEKGKLEHLPSLWECLRQKVKGQEATNRRKNPMIRMYEKES